MVVSIICLEERDQIMYLTLMCILTSKILWTQISVEGTLITSIKLLKPNNLANTVYPTLNVLHILHTWSHEFQLAKLLGNDVGQIVQF